MSAYIVEIESYHQLGYHKRFIQTNNSLLTILTYTPSHQQRANRFNIESSHRGVVLSHVLFVLYIYICVFMY